MRFGLQRKLTLSHLAVTLISVVILIILVFGGYLIYLQTDWPALWAGDQAYFIAEDIAWYLEDVPLTEDFAQEFIAEMGFVPISDIDEIEDIFYEDWIIILDRQGGVFGSNDDWRFPEGSFPALDELPGFDLELFHLPLDDLTAWDPYDLVSYAVAGNDHIGLAAIISIDQEHLGWVYYRAGGVDAPFNSNQTLTAAIVFLLSAAIVATVVSGIAGGWLSLSFSRRLRRLSQASAALASGDLSRRVSVQGQDEIDLLGNQFNQMAAQLADQVHGLRTLADHNAMLAEEARALASVEERNRLARELHDAVKQQVFALSLTANSIRQLLEKEPGQATKRLAQLETQARDIHIEMDTIIKQLRPASLEDQGLAPALRELIAKWEHQHQIPVSLRVQGERPLPLNIEQALYRVSQEALNNIARHAQATQITIMLEYATDEVRLSIKDNGCGFDTQARHQAQSLGLRSMEERIAEIAGELTLESKPNAGTQVQISVPVSAT
jgi:two-component system, NarL family, sensor histidine kinase LiaS